MRGPACLLAFGLLLGGCIIYETGDDRHRCERGDRCAHDTGGPWLPPRDTDPPDDDTDPSPQLALSVAEAEQGEAVLAWIQAEQGFDFGRIDRVIFTADIDVAHSEIRAREAFLLVQVPCGAEPGNAPVVIRLDDGAEVLVPGGFTIAEASSHDLCACDL